CARSRTGLMMLFDIW
nr:immunoglobulin heavy chain junction region [Macaca mulatta]MOV50424.1 immunoglobulin heavy chain junction region [Macaca mulatta]MOV50893.1 immunoglobulin heavy chain junction region [Macaca mulatta]MOV51056.1 immunoglobulin heavy chain junction region [Macaca mulatta]MOV51194.1 immunoglobulin heavy chain junction region [Macaca mulatta]